MSELAPEELKRRVWALQGRRLRLMVITAWCGLTWTVGYVVAPALFGMLSGRALAGDIAGALFQIQGWVSVVVGLLLLVMAMFVPPPPGEVRQSTLAQTDVRIVIAMVICTLIGYFGLQPLISVLRGAMAAHARLDDGTSIDAQFAIVHGVSAAFYLGHSLLGAWLVMRQAR